MDSEIPSTLFLTQLSKLDPNVPAVCSPRKQNSHTENHANASREDMTITSHPDSSTDVQELPPVDVGWEAWFFCFSATALEALVWGYVFSYGIFQEYYMSHAPFDMAPHVAVAAIGPVGLAMTYGEGILLYFFYGRYPDMVETSMWIGLGLYVISLISSAFVGNVWLLILFQGLGLGVAGGMLYWPTIAYLSEWFVRRRGLAGGITFAGSGLGGFVYPFIVNALLNGVGYRWTMLILALLQGVLTGVSLLGIKPRIPPPKYRKGQLRPQFIPPRIPFLKRGVFWAYSIANFLQGMAYTPVSLYIAIYTANISSPLFGTIVLALFNLAGVIGMVLIGYLSDRFPYPWIMFSDSLASMIIVFLLWGFADTLVRVFVFAVLFGCLGGGVASLGFAAAVDSSNPNTEQSAMALSAFTFVKGIAAVIGPIISSILLEAGRKVDYGSYGRFGFGPVEFFVGGCVLACSFGSLALAVSRPRV